MKSRPVHQVDSHLQFQDEFKKFQEYQGEWMIVPGPSIHFKKKPIVTHLSRNHGIRSPFVSC